MNYNNPLPRSISSMVKVACIVLFTLFSFIYLYFMQGDVLAEAQYVFSGGVTTYSRLWGAVIITIILLVVHFIMSRLSCLTGRWYAFTFLPSFVLLTIVTSLHRETIEHFSFGAWTWGLPLFVVAFCLFISVMRRLHSGSVEQGDYSVWRYLWTNFLILFVMMILCGSNSPAKDVYLYELKVERLLLEEDYEGAGRVGESSLVTSPRLNELRMYALAKQGLLGERLFAYPQPYAERSLIILDDTITNLHRFSCKNIQEALGAWANPSVTSVDQYLNLLRKNPSTSSNPLLADYVLCSQLLQGDLREFNRLLRSYYNISGTEAVMALPRAYREALLLQAKSVGRNALSQFADTIMLKEYDAYREIKDSDLDSLVKANKLHLQFAGTLWWHLDYEL